MNEKSIRRGKGSRIVMMFFCAMIIMFQCSLTLHAADYTEVFLPVTQKVDARDSQMSETFTYRLTALTEGIPMPEGSNGNIFEYKVQGNQSIRLGAIIYHDVGDYEYELAQVIDKSKVDFTCDTEVYAITVSVRENGDGALTSAIIAKNHNKEKVGTLSFTNAANRTATSDTPKEVDHSGNGTKTGPNTAKATVKTGDLTNIKIWVVCASAALLILLVVFVKKRKNQSSHCDTQIKSE